MLFILIINNDTWGNRFVQSRSAEPFSCWVIDFTALWRSISWEDPKCKTLLHAGRKRVSIRRQRSIRQTGNIYLSLWCHLTRSHVSHVISHFLLLLSVINMFVSRCFHVKIFSCFNLMKIKSFCVWYFIALMIVVTLIIIIIIIVLRSRKDVAVMKEVSRLFLCFRRRFQIPTGSGET